jgi:hypoxanthine phosphoribosyltransferase
VVRAMSDSSDYPSIPGGRILIRAGQIQARVGELGAEINAHYRGRRPLFIGVMNGALFFLADLLRAVDLDPEVSCLRLASYAGRESTGDLRGLEALDQAVAGRDILVVDDILDTGQTLTKLVARLRELGAAEVKICVLLEKERARELPVRADWIGFRIADEFVVGYGLDCDGRYRALKEIRSFS